MHFYINVQINPWFIAKGFWLFISTYNSLKSKVRKNKSLVIIRLWKNKWKQKHDIKKKKIQRRQKGWVSKENVRYCDFISNYHACLYCHYWLGVDSKFTTWQSCHISNFVFTPTTQIFKTYNDEWLIHLELLFLYLLVKVRRRRKQNLNWRWNMERQKVKKIWAPWHCYIWDTAARNSLPCPIQQVWHRSCSHQRKRCCPLLRRNPPHSL